MDPTTPTGGAPKRRVIFIEKAFQLRFIVKVTTVILLGTALTGVLLYALADREFGRAFYSAHYQARSSWELLLPAVLVSSFVAMCLVALVAVFLTLFDSHRIGGPLYRFKANLEQVGEGNLAVVTRLREKDELQSLTDAVNKMTRGLTQRVAAIREAEEEVGRWVEALDASGGGGSGEVAAGLRQAHARLRTALDAFRIGG